MHDSSLFSSLFTPQGSVAKHWDHLAERSAGIDAWCSRLPWQRSVDAAFGHRFTEDSETDDGETANRETANRETAESNSKQQIENNESRIANTTLGTSAVNPSSDVAHIEESWAYAFRHRRFDDGTPVLVPLDSVWAFASPIVTDASDGPSGNQSARHQHDIASLVGSLKATPDWRVAFVTGINASSSTYALLLQQLDTFCRLVQGEQTVRCVASLADGFEAYIASRSRVFRRNLRSATKTALANDLYIEIADHASVESILQRLLAIEHQSWKGRQGSGIVTSDMRALYSALVSELHTTRSLRVCFACQDGIDVGFVVGGVLGSTYRGLQISFVESARTLSIGNLLQLHEIERLCIEQVQRYDLGMDMEYKRLWCDELMITTPIVAVR
jgi:hypothetical protein